MLVLSLFSSALAASCTDADTVLFNEHDSEATKFQSDLKSCALKCGGQNPCTGNCMSKLIGYSHDCGQCFGGLSSCAVAHCVVHGCASNPTGDSCKSCMAKNCNPGFETCTGWTIPGTTSADELFAPLAKCTAADAAIFQKRDADATTFQSDLKSCALKCAGQNPCTGNCISKNQGYSQSCGQCFGGLSSCAVSHCVIHGCATNPTGSSCKSCMAKNCNPGFATCTGWTVPTVKSRLFASLFAPQAQCTTADAAVFQAHDADPAKFQKDLKSCALKCGGQNPCIGSCMSKEIGYSHGCGQCFGGLSSCAVSHCVVHGCASNPTGDSCKSCMAKNCNPAFATCTGWEVPTLAFE